MIRRFMLVGLLIATLDFVHATTASPCEIALALERLPVKTLDLAGEIALAHVQTQTLRPRATLGPVRLVAYPAIAQGQLAAVAQVSSHAGTPDYVALTFDRELALRDARWTKECPGVARRAFETWPADDETLAIRFVQPGLAERSGLDQPSLSPATRITFEGAARAYLRFIETRSIVGQPTIGFERIESAEPHNGRARMTVEYQVVGSNDPLKIDVWLATDQSRSILAGREPLATPIPDLARLYAAVDDAVADTRGAGGTVTIFTPFERTPEGYRAHLSNFNGFATTAYSMDLRAEDDGGFRVVASQRR